MPHCRFLTSPSRIGHVLPVSFWSRPGYHNNFRRFTLSPARCHPRPHNSCRRHQTSIGKQLDAATHSVTDAAGTIYYEKSIMADFWRILPAIGRRFRPSTMSVPASPSRSGHFLLVNVVVTPWSPQQLLHRTSSTAVKGFDGTTRFSVKQPRPLRKMSDALVLENSAGFRHQLRCRPSL